MKISKVETIVIGTNWRNLTVVKVSTDEGLVGLSEVRMVGHTGALIGYLEGAPRQHVLKARSVQNRSSCTQSDAG
ncbi:MAG: hypothetical protein R2845_13340 [Thermomicrobiales bacterium]